MSDAAGQVEWGGLVGSRNWRRVTIALSLALVFMAGCAAFFIAQGVDRQVNDLLAGYELRKSARELTYSLIDAESSQRGYVLTQDESYLGPYNDLQSTIEPQLDHLRALTVGNATQSSRVDVISGAVHAKLSEMALSVQLVRDKRLPMATDAVKTGRGVRLMDEVRQTLNSFIAEEDSKMLQNNAGLGQLRTALISAIIAALTGAVVLTYVLFNRTQREVSSLTRTQDTLSERVRQRTVELEESRAFAQRERDRVEVLLKDTNHRVGNSLATVSSLLGLQMMRSESEDVKEALDAARQRVHAVASSHRRLRLGDDMEMIEASEFLGAVIDDLQSTYEQRGPVRIVSEIETLQINSRDATTLGILVAELVTNAFKHAFLPGVCGTVWIRLRRSASGPMLLQVADNGQGAVGPKSPAEGGLGSVIVRQLALQFGGAPVYDRAEEGGLLVIIDMPNLGKASRSASATL